MLNKGRDTLGLFAAAAALIVVASDWRGCLFGRNSSGDAFRFCTAGNFMVADATNSMSSSSSSSLCCSYIRQDTVCMRGVLTIMNFFFPFSLETLATLVDDLLRLRDDLPFFGVCGPRQPQICHIYLKGNLQIISFPAVPFLSFPRFPFVVLPLSAAACILPQNSVSQQLQVVVNSHGDSNI